ncbi:hypothetical protein ABB37_02058 [Leptomonas pyrrhocoris]|uniref:RPGR-interacting protein 1 first C2 domain-containing protein n=1 Tax=Leptomonas pyrrhocoris TaxID=157538 RepID=A0A0M9G7D7_LEPPY|nr:hypothetical protein ABB37_02058 [Leptomonas pyrrhocoris]XP_015662305.1 hypothetical protein ABB37_02058 [Leptomonas pyrrhocoris]KPA83865.1 hypothetical protein ABB37_02058 [Leptomonas pyrrhocoris]KPA83866.1 hypothetical protein ABB37_02058 [Leptomonas pyrrhocoris]|eukprot:XP_015662304.1 hypothetical protein ABB37_02058 [Leptomonas pyrrhocoris]
MSSKPPARTARPPGIDWQDSYFSLDERYRQLQKSFHEQEQALKLMKVARRKNEAPPKGPSLSSTSARQPSSWATTHAAGNPALTSSYGYENVADSRGRLHPPYRARPRTSDAGPFHPPLNPVSPAFTQQSHAAFEHVASDALSPSADQEGPLRRGDCAPPAAPHSLPSTSFSPSPQPEQQSGPTTSSTQEYVSVPSAAQPQAARAAAIAEASAWGDAAALPDPAMVWGTDGQSSMQNYVVASALYHANEELRRKLNESSGTLQTFQRELAGSRAQCAAVQTRLDNAAQQMHQLVRERDLATQKLTNASHTIADMERTLRDRVGEEEKIRFSMETQIAELRSRLVVGADSNELLQKDVRSLLTETRDRTGEVMQLRSKLALAESALSAQRNANENMLVELKSLNAQLVEERKRLITVTREAQVASLSGTRVADLEAQLRRVQAERNSIEHEHVGLMSEFVRVTEEALRHAREEVRTDVADWKAAAGHWEQVSQLLYKDIAERTQQHLQCRADCEEAKEQRDTAALQARALKDEVALLAAKLDIVWPSHVADTKDLTVDDIQNVFGRKDRQGILLFDERCRKATAAAAAKAAARRRREQCASEAKEPGEANGVESEPGSEEETTEVQEDEGFKLTASFLADLPADPTSAAAQLQELHEVNATLLSEVHRLQLTNDLLQDRLDSLAGQQKDERARMAAAETSLQRREKTGHKLLERQLDRVAFLEAQVKSLRGYHVASNAPIDQLGDNENIFELFLGQLVAAEVPEGVGVPDLFSHVFCSVDFLLHETITTPTVRGLNGFFDVTASFCVSMDTLLLYYLHTRKLLVQLHRVRSEGETTAAIAAATTEAKEPPTGEAAGGGEHRRAKNGGGRGSLGGSSAVTGSSSASSSTHPSLRMAENMFETIAEGQVSLVDIILSEECRHSARPTMKGHVHLYTPGKRHIASLELRLTARRPYSPAFLRAVQEAVEKSRTRLDDGDAVLDAPTSKVGEDSHLLDWMRMTANTSAEADLQPMGDVRLPLRASRTNAVAPDVTKDQPTERTLHWPSAPLQSSATALSRLHRSQMQLVLVADADDATSSSSSFYVQQRSRMSETSGALVVHLPAPSPPPSRFSRNASPWSARAPSSSSAAEGVEDGGRADPSHRFSSFAAHAPAEQESRSPYYGPASFIHVDRSLLTQPTPTRDSTGGALAGAVTCLWVDVERLELPADLPPPVPRLSCYFRVDALQKEVWLAAPPTARYTWPYSVDRSRDSAATTLGIPLPVLSITQLAAVVREPLVLFFLDADAMAAPPPPPATAGSDTCVWAMAVCEWNQAVQHPDEPHAFRLPLIRRDQSVVAGAVVRLSLTATTTNSHNATTPSAVHEYHGQQRAPAAFASAAATSFGVYAGGTGASATVTPPPPPPFSMTNELPSASAPPPMSAVPAQQPPTGDGPRASSMEEELLRLEYEQRLSRKGI